jgi:hypothetical protein
MERVAIDGSKVKANASKHKAMSYDRMGAKQQQLNIEAIRLAHPAPKMRQTRVAATCR